MKKNEIRTGILASLLAIFTMQPGESFAQSDVQALEEIVVTAQRRTQSLQDVPISVYALSGEEMQRQGFKELRDMSNFIPTLIIDDHAVTNPKIILRGIGTRGNNATMESAVPVFVDNIHYSRQSMIRTAFLDVESVEVLKGPQPVYFGQNATAGAVSIRSKRPTPEWEGNFQLDFDDRQGTGVELAAGGPITDTVGIRAALNLDKEDGYIKHIVTGDGIGFKDNLGGRFSLQWKPNNQLTILGKVDVARLKRDAEVSPICWGGGSTFEDNDPTIESVSNDVVFKAPPYGQGWEGSLQTDLAEAHPEGCGKETYGIGVTGPFYTPPLTSRGNDSDAGHPDVRLAVAGVLNDPFVEGFYERDKPLHAGISSPETLRTKSAALTTEYQFDNGISTEWNVAFLRYRRDYIREQTRSLFVERILHREEDYSQWSTELRFTSPTGGMFEWALGGFIQLGDLDIFAGGIEGGVRRPQRFNKISEDQEWKSVFGVLTFNFLDNRASIDLGARYSDLLKVQSADGYGNTWIYDSMPCLPNADPDFQDFQVRDVDPDTYDPAVCDPHPWAVQVNADTDNPRIYDSAADLTNLWTIPYDSGRVCDAALFPFPYEYDLSNCPGNANRPQYGRQTPPNWRGGRAHAVGVTAPCFECREQGPRSGTLSPTNFDPQIVLRYRPREDMSFYARYATAFKAGGFDTGTVSLATSIEDYIFLDEHAETYEGGVKGTFAQGRGRYDLNLFWVEIKDLQLQVSTIDPISSAKNINAGAQRVQGLEWSTAYAFSDQFRVGFSGALMDGVMSEFPGAPCTETEFENPASSGCDVDPASPFFETVDRTGQSAPDSPDWKFVVDLDYWMPMPRFPQLRLSLNTKAYMSAGYCDSIGDCGTTRWPMHWDANVGFGIGDMDGVWDLDVFIRNLNHPTEKRYLDEIEDPDFGISKSALAPSEYVNYGVRFRYNFF